eukprot:jgi/Galph1/2708/GphlegSOOS_G1368.1
MQRNEANMSLLQELYEGFKQLSEAPTLYPTEEEFMDPIGYVRKNKSLISSFGIARIVPPPSWKPPMLIDHKKKFETKRQNIHQLCNRTTPHDLFVLGLRKYLLKKDSSKLEKIGEPWKDLESSDIMINGSPIDLYVLYKDVMSLGGFENVTAQGKWSQLVRSQLILGSIEDDAPKVLQDIYREYLLDFEISQKKKHKNMAIFKSVNERKARSTSISHDMCLPAESDFQKDADSPFVKEGYIENLRSKYLRTTDHFKQMATEFYGSSGENECLMCSQRLNDSLSVSRAFCKECDPLNKQKFGFLEGCAVDIEDIREYSDIFREKWFHTREYRHGISVKDKNILRDPFYLEAEYWRLVDSSLDAVSVHYGSDLYTNLCGSGFPSFANRENFEKTSLDRKELLEEYDKYLLHPWNLNIIPELSDSLLSCLNVKIPGISIPWLYVGMLFSSFCWHNEDSYMYSLNYMHEGEGKVWYGAPGGKSAALFEAAMELCIPELFETNPDLLYNMVTTVNPLRLSKFGAPICRTVQYAGDFIITMPQAYHAGFSLGYTCAEAVNFACTEWLPFAWAAHARYIALSRAPAFTLEELFIEVINSPDFLAKTKLKEAKCLLRYLQKVVSFELAQREKCFGICTRTKQESKFQTLGECVQCKHACYFSSVVLEIENGKIVYCLNHIEEAAEHVNNGELTFIYKFTKEEINLLLVRAQEVVMKKQRVKTVKNETVADKTAIEHIVLPWSH